MSDLSVYNLGSMGVNVDSSPIHKEDGELLEAQNLVQNVEGVRGGVTNRPGLTKHNDDDMGSTVLGGAPMSTPSGGDKGQISTAILWWGEQTNGGVNVWYRSNDLFVSSLTWALVDPPSVWQADPAPALANIIKRYRMVELNGRIYYPGTYTSGTTAPTIRMFNGKEDYQFSKILPETTLWIENITVSRGRIFFITVDSGTDDTNWVSRVFELDPVAGHVTQIGGALDTGYYGTCLCVHNNDLYVGASKVTEGNTGRIYRLRLDVATSFSTELSSLGTEINACYQLLSFKGSIYAATGSNDSNGANHGLVLKQTALGTWATVDTGTTARGGNFTDLVVFNGKIYSLSQSAIATGGGIGGTVLRESSDGSSWTSVASSGSAPSDFSVGVSYLQTMGNLLFVLGHNEHANYAATPSGTWVQILAPGVNGGGGTGSGSRFMVLRP